MVARAGFFSKLLGRRPTTRMVLRLSGRGTQGATLRVYLEIYVSPAATSTRISRKPLAI